jgi:TonB family protein
MTAKVVSVGYGRGQWWTLHQRNALAALVIAVLLHCLVIVTYYVAGELPDEGSIPSLGPRRIPYDRIPQVSIEPTSSIPQVAVAEPAARVTPGVPVPVPDVLVDPEQTIPSKDDYHRVADEHPGVGKDEGTITVEEPAAPDETEEVPPFRAVEKLPVPVKEVSPEYPEIARRAGVEGTVWVKVIVDKDGRVRKAEIVKSDADIFNDAAISAAKQWVFTPAMMNNGPVAVWASIPFRFRLHVNLVR